MFHFTHGNQLYMVDYSYLAGVIVRVPNYPDYTMSFNKLESGEKKWHCLRTVNDNNKK